MNRGPGDATLSKFHFLTVEVAHEKVNLLIEISNQRLNEATFNKSAASETAFTIACAILASRYQDARPSLIYSREISRPLVDADSSEPLLLSDGSKAWLVKRRSNDP